MMTYRNLLNALELMREKDATLLNHKVSIKVTDDEYFNVENLFITDSDNEYLNHSVPVLIVS